MNDFLWVEKYRPQKVEDCILPTDVKNTFKGFVEQGEIPNLLLSGTAGIGNGIRDQYAGNNAYDYSYYFDGRLYNSGSG